MKTRALFAVVLVVGGVVPAAAAHATISSATGQISLISPPPVASAVMSQTVTFAWDEQQGVTLASPIAVDITATGTYDTAASLTPGTIPVGTVVDSQFFHSQRVASTAALRTATLTFPTDVIGIAVTRTTLDNSNVLGATGTDYTTGTGTTHGLELATTADGVSMPDLRTVNIRVTTANLGDEVRIITKHNSPPTANAGGPYSANEGSPVTLHGVAADPDGDSVQISWSFNVTAAPGTACTTANTTTLSPTITCNDDATITATLSASDSSHPPVLSDAQVTIANVAPVLAPLTVPNTLVALTSPVSVSGTFTDAGTHDTHTATVEWGDTSSTSAGITESNGAGSASASHVYSSRGHYTITVTLRDDNGGIATRTAQVDVNGPPAADAGGPYTGIEGTQTGLVGTAVDPENDPLTTTWTFTPTAQDPGTTCTATGTSTLAPTVTCNDDAVIDAQLSASDNINTPVLSHTVVTVNNVPPVFGTTSQTAGAHAVGAGVTVNASFSDAGTHDTHSATVNWGDLSVSNATISEANGSGSLSATHAYAQPGLYTVSIVLSDDNGGTDTANVNVLVNAPPTVDAGGPYVGVEGAQMTLDASANDVDGDTLTYSWTFTWTGDPGTQCTATGTHTLTPIVNCNDDAIVTATLSVNDGVNAPVVETALLTVGNIAPALGAVVPSATLVPTGGTFSVSAVFSDAGINDSHSATIDWGDGSTSSATVSELNGSGTVSDSRVYAAPGTYIVTVFLTDDNAGTAVGTTQVVVNAAPTVSAGGAYTGVEGAPLTLAGTAHDPDADPLTKSWVISWSGDPGTGCELANASTLTPTVTCNDDALVTAELTVSDGVNAPVASATTITIGNAAPVVGAVSLPTAPNPTGVPVSVTASFTDPGANDTHTATIDWGDSSTTSGTVSETAGSGTVTDSHVYATNGSYTVTVTVTDDNDGHGARSGTVAINGSPTVGAGGPYDTDEGAPVTLYGTATDPEGDPHSISWTRTITSADPGTTCSFTNTATLTPTIVCNDDAVVTVTLHASDGVNTSITDSTTVTVHNVAPAVAPPSASPNPAGVGGAVSLHTTFTDAAAHDTHVATIDWGDSATTSGTVSESAGAGTVSGTHAYGSPGTYHVAVTVTDDNGGSSTVSIDVVVNGPPTVNSGGPYTGVEGAPVTLGANATDPEDDHLAISWTRTIVAGDPGVACTFTGTATLTPTLTCNDNALVSVTVTASDGINAPVTDTTTVTIINEPPVVSTPQITPNPVVVGAPVSLSASFTDPGVHDTHIATINWGDATTANGTVSETNGSGTVTRSHAYSTAGTYTVTVTVNDNDGGIGTASAQVVVYSLATAAAGGPYTGIEGFPVTLHGTVTNPGGGPLGISWSITWTGSPGTACSLSGSTSLNPSVTCNDDAVVTATLSASDGANAPVTSAALVNIANVAPTIDSITIPISPLQVATPIALQATFSDVGTNDSHTAAINWGDASSSTGTITEANGAGTVTASHAFAAAGTYIVNVTVTDDNNGSVSTIASNYVVVYDPAAGFVTGGGWISSPTGAYTPANPANAGLVGRANFGFVSKYLPGGTTPSGNTEFDLKSASLNFHATGMAWLVVTNTATKAYYAGTGTVNGTAGYNFLVSVIDGGHNSADRFRIRVSNASSGAIVYDNQYGSADSDSATQLISGGSVVIHA
jgi:hypothetical protein